MYQFPNQQLYHHDGYQECPLYCETKNLPETITENNQFPFVNHHCVPSNFTKPCESQVETSSAKKSTKKSVKPASVDTSNFSIEERLVAAVWVHERKRNKISMSQIKNEFRQRFGRDPPAKNTLIVWERKLFSSGSVHDAPRPGRPIKRRNHIDEVAASIRSAPELSLRARASTLRVPHTTLRTILQKDLPNVAVQSKDSSHKKGPSKQPVKRIKKKIVKKLKPKLVEQTNPQMSAHYNFQPQYIHPHNLNQNGYVP